MDPVSAELIRAAMETVAYEIATHVSLTATTPIPNQSNQGPCDGDVPVANDPYHGGGHLPDYRSSTTASSSTSAP
jgi:N-methylhydantoinase B